LVAPTPLALILDPAVYALVLAGLEGTMLYATALQHGPLTTTAALTVVGQTVGPAVIGWFVLGDGVRRAGAYRAGRVPAHGRGRSPAGPARPPAAAHRRRSHLTQRSRSSASAPGDPTRRRYR
jgi:hypothetical protein